MTQFEWRTRSPLTIVSQALSETMALWKISSGRTRVAGFVITTVAEALGLIFWLNLTLQGHYVLGAVCLIAGEAVEWGALAYLMVKSPLSHPRKTGRIAWGLVASGLISLSEALLWLGWFQFSQSYSLFLATVLLLVGMHIKHVSDMTVFTGKSWWQLVRSDRDIVASIIEVGGAAIWFMIAMAGYIYLAGAFLVVAIFIEHILQFKTAGLLVAQEELD